VKASAAAEEGFSISISEMQALASQATRYSAPLGQPRRSLLVDMPAGMGINGFDRIGRHHLSRRK
jgi:hypothetical protein